MGEHPEGISALDDREHLQATVRGHQPRGDRVPRLVRRDEALLVLGVGHGLAHAHFLDEACPLDIAARHGTVAATECVHEPLVEEVLDHHRGVPLRDGRETVARIVVVEVGVVRFASEEEVDQLATAGLGRRLEGEPAVETPRP
ncbi:unannotated protein [freshwater metagenome]|uniref:Unannotated protein n=1 Tax=freshwater metagenome TaxID=449393 RepID=A0A6J7C0A5_9ZZZZ